ncbi:MAG TPA: hypothetical protein VET87_14320, partial [Rubrivivax sp.]|nr:hypothetical protein [Rubrivivax sp.]
LALREVRLGERRLAEGSVLTLDGNDGTIFEGATQTVQEAPLALLQRLAALRVPAGAALAPVRTCSAGLVTRSAVISMPYMAPSGDRT